MNERGNRRVLLGKVVSDKMEKSAVVQVEKFVKHRIYKKYIKRYKKYAAHDENNECRMGDIVKIIESRPLSKTKKFRVQEVVKRAL
ncbi:MAG: 30S ribosomal protein S17 [Thermodesulfobacteriota bacterium]|nr:30S ribosomal protein S17 [Thermodesulfobacteriota bacterium]